MEDFVRVVNRKRYSVATSKLLATDKSGKYFLYRTAGGELFTVQLASERSAMWDLLLPIPENRGMRLYANELEKHEVPFEEAFPDVEVVDA